MRLAVCINSALLDEGFMWKEYRQCEEELALRTYLDVAAAAAVPSL